MDSRVRGNDDRGDGEGTPSAGSEGDQRLTGGGSGSPSLIWERPTATAAVPANSRPAEAQSTPAAVPVPMAAWLPVACAAAWPVAAWHMAGTACTPAALMAWVQPLA